MSPQTLHWAVFCAVLAPLCLRSPSDPLAVTALHIGIGLVMVALADRIERST